jgi:hypothetical protein
VSAVCWQAFSQKSSLVIHKSVHSGEKPLGMKSVDKALARCQPLSGNLKYTQVRSPVSARSVDEASGIGQTL